MTTEPPEGGSVSGETASGIDGNGDAVAEHGR